MLKVMTIVGTRPELIKMSRVIDKLDKNTNHILVHTGQNYDYELNQIFFDELKIRKPDYFLEVAGENTAQTIANIIERTDKVIEAESPDAFVIYGDTNSCLSVISAKRRKVPVFHMEAGNRCFDQRVPEELNRKIIDQLSDINIVLSDRARENLVLEGIRPETIFKSGSHMKEVLDYYMSDVYRSDVLNRLKLKSSSYFVFSFHREENIDDIDNLKTIIKSIKAVSATYNLPVIVSTHPRTKKALDDLNISTDEKIIFSKPFGLFDYIKLQINAKCVVSDSGTITEESSLLGFPAVTIRNTHERPEGMDNGVLIMSGVDTGSIMDSVDVAIKCGKPHAIDEYNKQDVSTHILKLIYSHTGYINRTVWHK
ncbi:MAG: UDP-N-acetylglucosamine 2-epimerase (non-hydrolyzing) [Melioribacteraceae bacterium]